MTDIFGVDALIVLAALLGVVVLVLIFGLRWPGKKGAKRDWEHKNARLYIEGRGECELIKSHIRYPGNSTNNLIEKLRKHHGSEDLIKDLEQLKGVPLFEVNAVTSHGNEHFYNVHMIPVKPEQLDNGYFYVNKGIRNALTDIRRLEDSLLLELETREQEVRGLTTDHISWTDKITTSAKGWKKNLGGSFPIPMQKGAGGQFSTGQESLEGMGGG